MNVLSLSPEFPPQFGLFSTALAERGVRVFGLGQAPFHELGPKLQGAFTEYVHVPWLEQYPDVVRAVEHLVQRHGPMDHIESNIEHWLSLEAQLRRDFSVKGLLPETLDFQRSKRGMAELFKRAGVRGIQTVRFESAGQARAFAERNGFPLILKPETGVGAARTYEVKDTDQLEQVLTQPLEGYLLQPFIHGTLHSFDGLTDANGKIIYRTGHLYSSGVLQILRDQLDFHYYSHKDLPAGLEEVGRTVVKAFDIRARFFHIEFFETAPGVWCALEVNLRPPGGFTTDMMNYAADIDVYRAWAGVMVGDPRPLTGRPRYHVAHVCRRDRYQYRTGHEEIVRALGSALVFHARTPQVFAAVLGDWTYLVRSEELPQVRAAIELIQAKQ
jgi:hypothetical protein